MCTTMAGMLRTILIALYGLWLASTMPGPAAAQSEPVRQAQQRLDALGLSPGPIDGRMGDLTREALRAFQRGRDLPVTGELDWPTRTALGATVRTERRGSAAPVPRAVPVPDVLISTLPAPGGEPVGADELRPSAVDGPDIAVAAAAGMAESRPEPPVDSLQASSGYSEPPRVGAPPSAESAPVAPDDRPAWLLWLAIGLGLTAAGAWVGLLLWWLRQRSRRAAVAATD